MLTVVHDEKFSILIAVTTMAQGEIACQQPKDWPAPTQRAHYNSARHW
jgi:hypothetical protein